MNPDTIVLIHGFWVTPRSWEHWKAHYEQQGYRVLTPAYPGFEVEVEAPQRRPDPDREPERAGRHRTSRGQDTFYETVAWRRTLAWRRTVDVASMLLEASTGTNANVSATITSFDGVVPR
jgi:hypothetical protein